MSNDETGSTYVFLFVAHSVLMIENDILSSNLYVCYNEDVHIIFHALKHEEERNKSVVLAVSQ